MFNELLSNMRKCKTVDECIKLVEEFSNIYKAKQLCDLKICCSTSEARRIVAQGAFDHVIKKANRVKV